MSHILGFLILLPFSVAFWLTWKIVNACVKKGGPVRALGALLCLLVGGFAVLAGWRIGPTVGWIIMVCGGLIAIFVSLRALLSTKKDIEEEEAEEKLKELDLKERLHKPVADYLYCPKCGLENWEGYNNCQKCGAQLKKR